MTRPGAGLTPLTGAAERAVLRLLRSCSYQGTVARLGSLVGFDSGWMIGALLRLAHRGFVKVEALSGGIVAVNITAAGRYAIGRPVAG